MKAITATVEAITEAARTGAAQRQSRWTDLGLTQLLSEASASPLSELLDTRLKPQQLAATNTERTLQHAAERHTECKRCPATGGACADSTDRPGKKLRWDHETMTFAYEPCERWDEFMLCKRLCYFGVPERMLDARFKNFTVDDDARKMLRQWVLDWGDPELPKGESVHLHGGVGVGKTHIAAAAVRALTVKHARARIHFSAVFAYVPSFLSNLRDLYNAPLDERREWIERVNTCDLLVLDDLGAERSSPWVQEQLGVIINERWSNQRAVLLTSNRTIEQCGAALGERAASRLKSMCVLTHGFKNTDQRAQ